MREGDKNYSPAHRKQTPHMRRDDMKKTKPLKPKSSISRTSSTTSVDIGLKIHNVDDMDGNEEFKDARDHSEDVITDPKVGLIGKVDVEERDGHSVEPFQEVESDTETARLSILSPGEMQPTSVNKIKRASRVPQQLIRKQSADTYSCSRKDINSKQGVSKLQFKPSPRRLQNGDAKNSEIKLENSKTCFDLPSELSDLSINKINGEMEADLPDEEPDSCPSVETEEELADTEEDNINTEKIHSKQNMKEMLRRIEQLEDELREIAVLEISLYSVAPEHGSSAYKVHTPARRLSRLYVHACKHWSLEKRASIARNSISGLVLIAKSCGSDAARLTFWWSNIILLRETICQMFGSVKHSIVMSNGDLACETEKMPSSKVIDSSPRKMCCFIQSDGNWQDSRTFIAALEKIESWIFSRTVESVWWQALAPYMMSSIEDISIQTSSSRIPGPALGDMYQGSISMNLWKNAFKNAYQKLCPVRAVGHKCGCLSILAKMVIEQLVGRLDVAMFNAILRESAHEIPTDPVSDPIVDARVLPIPAGNLSFASGAQIKNSIGNWSRYLTDLCGIYAVDTSRREMVIGKKERALEISDTKPFSLLNALSDLLMLPKDMLVSKSIREEVCPIFSLSMIKRILCNFIPDEFCPDAVPCYILETLSTESISERDLSDKDIISGFPCKAPSLAYFPPSPAEVAERFWDYGGKELNAHASNFQTKSYISDEDLDELDYPLASVIDKMSPHGNRDCREHNGVNQDGSILRYRLLREIW